MTSESAMRSSTRRLAFWVLSFLLLAAGGTALRPARSVALVAQEPAGDGMAPFTLRIVFGQQDAAPADWNGSLQVDNGRLDDIRGWRTSDRDAVGPGGWKLRTQRWVTPDGAPSPPRPVAASGVNVYGSGTDAKTRIRLTTPRGAVELGLGELRA